MTNGRSFELSTELLDSDSFIWVWWCTVIWLCHLVWINKSSYYYRHPITSLDQFKTKMAVGSCVLVRLCIINKKLWLECRWCRHTVCTLMLLYYVLICSSCGFENWTLRKNSDICYWMLLQIIEKLFLGLLDS